MAGPRCMNLLLAWLHPSKARRGGGCAGSPERALAAHWPRGELHFGRAAKSITKCSGKQQQGKTQSSLQLLKLLSWLYPVISASFLGKWPAHSSHASPGFQGHLGFCSGTDVPLLILSIPLLLPLPSQRFLLLESPIFSRECKQNSPQRWVMCYRGALKFLVSSFKY